RKKTPSKRSRTGCRTCRARRVKCDEFPGACKNCSSTGRVCGYDTHRPPPGVSPGGSLRAELTHKPQWIMTSDEQRCLSFFQHRSLPHLVGFFDSPLWQNLIHRLSYAEPAVYHALVALGAVSQANNIKGHLPRPGEKKDLQNIWYRFALEQSGRSMALLIKRRTSQDPQLQQVVLVCCLLFIVAELRYGNFDRASVHLQSGLRILQSMNIQRQPSGLEIPSGAVDECIVESFLALQAGSRYYCAVAPLRCDSDFIYTQPYDSYLCPFENIRQARQLWRPLEQTVFEFMATGMKTFGPQMEANYDTVHRQQLQLLYYVTRYLQQFDTFCLARYGTTSFMSSNPARYKEQREAELIRLSCLTALLGVKVAVYSPVRPPAHGYVRERLALLAAAETAMDKFDKDPPTFTEHSLMAPSLYTAAWGSPDYFIYCRAIDLLQRWGSVEGFLSASLNADLLNEVLKELVL
ncbi:Zn(II)2Cys6 transcription factor, partial [Aspergillus ibericus CBS 121593]